MSYKVEDKDISNLFTSNRFEIPRNQRKYVWTKENWSDLLEDLKFISSNPINRKHFLGSIVLQKKNTILGIKYFDVIDGQQRIITIIVLLSAMMLKMKELGMMDAYNVTLQYLLVRDRDNKTHCTLTSGAHPYLTKLVEDHAGNPTKSFAETKKEFFPTIQRLDKKIYDCLAFFLTSLEQITGEDLEKLRNTLIDTRYVDVIADTEEDSYTIFEILNARGVGLEQYEMIKNYIMRYTQPQKDEHIDNVKQQWGELESELKNITIIRNFFFHYILHKYKDTQKKDVFYDFKSKVPKDKINEAFDDIILKASFYKDIAFPDTAENIDEEEKSIYRTLNKYKSIVFNPLILSLMHRRHTGDINGNEYKDILRHIYRFFIVYTLLSNETSNKIMNIVKKFAMKFENEYTPELIDEFTKTLKSKYPDFKNFCERFSKLGWSNHNELYKEANLKDKVRIVLEMFESHASGIHVSIDIDSIEHILPDSQGGDNYLIGNLLPLERKINDACKDKPLAEKLPQYAKSAYLVTRKFYDRNKDNPDAFDPKKRTLHMASIIYKDILKIDK